jgi:hypothetical protein
VLVGKSTKIKGPVHFSDINRARASFLREEADLAALVIGCRGMAEKERIVG